MAQILPPRATRLRSALALGLFVAAFAIALVPTLEATFVKRSKADHDDEDNVVKVPSRVTVKDGVVTVTLDAKARQAAGIITAHPDHAPKEEQVVGYGAVLDATGLTNLSNQYRDAKSQVQTAEAKLAVTRAVFDRAKTLFKDRQAVSEAQLQTAEGNFLVDQATLATAQSRLATVSASARQAWGTALADALIQRAPLVENLLDRRDYLVKVTLTTGHTLAEPPPKASTMASGGAAAVSLDLISLATSTEPSIQGISYFYDAPATDGILPGRNLLVCLPAPESPAGVVVPQAAAVWFGGKAWIYLRKSDDTFVRRQITPAGSVPNGGYIVTGLSSDSEIVVQGAQMLVSEEFRGQTAGGGGD